MTFALTSYPVDPGEIRFTFVRSSGPGGQNVNKVSSAAQLRFDVRGSPSLSGPVKARLQRLAGARLTRDGVIVIQADRFRTREPMRVASVPVPATPWPECTHPGPIARNRDKVDRTRSKLAAS